jgi:hypothetical protein
MTLPWMLSGETFSEPNEPKEAFRSMSSRLISLEARERLRAQQAEEAKAVSAHTAACSRLESVVEKRAEVVAAQDQVVAAAETDVAVAAAGVVAVSGFARAAAILGATPTALRRQLAAAKSNGKSAEPGSGPPDGAAEDARTADWRGGCADGGTMSTGRPGGRPAADASHV